ncbi:MULTISPECIES: hypothetical protein [Bradyrhizobium]|uniref:Uncharacterized protein n=5 Tax=Bradyrhizobium TaxID=374 RepID=A0A9X1RDM5_9BRAD|nr:MULTISPECIES: hypothetical protein [Bradyrhizobium]MCG2628270.1 hypothetical protein [Bradyrhizobium zhengyangense]MCG2643389.1 hypothetical protein [Bradyrhizobium zhengyangense]MCG2670297.1 hypothetical protein [Bradyrhizobium zhengyangense]MDN4985969.1 hypothetical protein [Bradyrhizobium sp. WYCCWR 13022]MDN5002651.1 hypothetical protein [Bradyrhizobium sp. WYCCWR 12677]
MWKISRAAACLGACFAMGGCTSLYYVHDPQTGVITAGELPYFLKSIRCEVVTFYQIERERRKHYLKIYKTRPEEAFDRFAHFDIDPFLYGTFFLELKVTDTGGVGSGTAFDYKRVLSATTAEVTHVGPTASAQDTYDLIWSFLLKQNAELASDTLPLASSPATYERGCYRGTPTELLELEALAENKYPERAAFKRITVDASKPLAAWLRDNAILIAANNLTPAMPSEIAEPAQMTYTFSIQVTGGIEAKYSLTSARWTPAAIQASASAQQFSNLGIYINGPNAVLANGAKSGSASYAAKQPALGSKDNPIYTTPIPGGEKSQELPESGGAAARRPRAGGGPRTNGFIFAPVPVFPPSPTPTQ